MKTTLAILISALASTVGAFADQPVFNSKGALIYIKHDTLQATASTASAAFNACCDTRNYVTPKPSGKGVDVTNRIDCNSGCTAPHAGKSCDNKERKVCAN
jgi:hypothetical protein